MTLQKDLGDGFEFACLWALAEIFDCIVDKDGNPLNIAYIRNKKYESVRKTFEGLTDIQKKNLTDAAIAGMMKILEFEPKLLHADFKDRLYVGINEDFEGEHGDVRDIICIRDVEKWEIGISCKHDNDAVKHSRLSMTIDFGAKWLKHPCSKEYWLDIGKVFEIVDKWASNGDTWRQHSDKTQVIYKPTLIAFMNEFRKLAEQYPDVAANFVKYVIGEYDFYKVMTDDANRVTKVQAFCLGGNLSLPSKDKNPLMKIKKLPLPDHVHSIGFAKGSDNKIEIVLNAGWAFTLRIHNASSYVENSLKFDIRMIGCPTELHSFDELWNQE